MQIIKAQKCTYNAKQTILKKYQKKHEIKKKSKKVDLWYKLKVKNTKNFKMYQKSEKYQNLKCTKSFKKVNKHQI